MAKAVQIFSKLTAAQVGRVIETAIERNSTLAAAEYGLSPETARRWVRHYKNGRVLECPDGSRVEPLNNAESSTAKDPATEPASFSIPELPDEELSAADLKARKIQDYKRRKEAYLARMWREIKVKISGPWGLACFGDFHLDDNGCDWEQLDHDLRLVGGRNDVAGAHMGDATNNWIGRLSRLWKEQETTQSQAIILLEDVIKSYGIHWAVWLLGNHDIWTSEMGYILDYQLRGKVKPENWQAKVKFVFPNGRESMAWFRHSFPGFSQYNPNHALGKAATRFGLVDLVIAGHEHDASEERRHNRFFNRVQQLVRVKGYKDIDPYADDQLGFPPLFEGHAALVVFDPDSTKALSFIRAFDDLEEGLDYLTFKRKARGY